MIADATIHFKKGKISTLLETRVLVPLIEAFAAVFPLPQLLVLLVEEAATRTSIKASTKEFKGVFSNLALGRNSIDFSTLTSEERKFMEAMFGGKTDFKMVRILERVITIPSDISTMSDESFHHQTNNF
jgi:hypothetical protein